MMMMIHSTSLTTPKRQTQADRDLTVPSTRRGTAALGDHDHYKYTLTSTFTVSHLQKAEAGKSKEERKQLYFAEQLQQAPSRRSGRGYHPPPHRCDNHYHTITLITAVLRVFAARGRAA